MFCERPFQIEKRNIMWEYKNDKQNFRNNGPKLRKSKIYEKRLVS